MDLAPPAGFIKINVDAALSKGSAAAAVARNTAGNFMGFGLVLSGIFDPQVLEAVACVHKD